MTLTIDYHIFLKLLEEQGLDSVMGGAEMVEKEPAPASAPEEKRPTLSLEELEAKQGNIIKIIDGKFLNAVKNINPALLKATVGIFF